MNWRIIVGGLLISGAVSEMFSIWRDYSSGKLKFWPFGADIAAIIMIVGGMYLLRKGMNKTNSLKK